MAAEKFFENGGRPLNIADAAQFVNGKLEEVKGDLSSPSPLPSPVCASSPRPKSKLTATVIIPIWIVLSSSVIIYNNYLYNTLNFKFPVFLVTFHLSFAVRAQHLCYSAYTVPKSRLSTGLWHACTATDNAPP